LKDWIDQGLVRAFAAEKTDAYRFCTARDGWVERFGDDALLSYKSEAARDRLTSELAEWTERNAQAFTRVFARFLPRQNVERSAPQLVAGEANLPLTRTVTERDVSYAIDFGAGYSVGLFLDQRENREFVRRAAPRRLLNCFAYTCSFSVVAALGGGDTLNIDLSRKSLARGRANFELNRLTTDGHRFLADDVLEVLPRLARKSEKFDNIILDPPTFSRSHSGKAWQVERDFEQLITLALEVASPEAKILLSTNCTRLDLRALEAMARFAQKASRRSGKLQPTPSLPDFPPGAGARSVWLLLR
jgi:23S rRNA (cytosine1962-C5)-methyltransferase